MNREQAINYLKSSGMSEEQIKAIIDAFTCDDCISRDEAIRLAEQGQIQGYEWQFKKLCTLPSVTPQPKIGKWLDCYKEMPIFNAGGFTETKHVGWTCSCCGENNFWIKSDYCPNCGAKMEVEE
jgi:hypothetical protein